MNELNLHIEYVQRHPRDRLAARALVDRIEEEHGCTRAQALRAVADYVVVARNVHAVLLATRICRKGAKYLYTAQVIVGWHVGEPETRFKMLIRDGWQTPLITRRPFSNRRARRDTPWVTVGARWLLVALRNHLRRVSRVKKELHLRTSKVHTRRSVEKFERSKTNASYPFLENNT